MGSGIFLNWEMTRNPFFFLELGEVLGVYRRLEDFDDLLLLRPRCDLVPFELDLLEPDFLELERDEFVLDLLRPRF